MSSLSSWFILILQDPSLSCTGPKIFLNILRSNILRFCSSRFLNVQASRPDSFYYLTSNSSKIISPSTRRHTICSMGQVVRSIILQNFIISSYRISHMDIFSLWCPAYISLSFAVFGRIAFLRVHLSILSIYTFLLPEEQMGDVREPFKKQNSFANRGSFYRK
jgi:hypothetical protein